MRVTDLTAATQIWDGGPRTVTTLAGNTASLINTGETIVAAAVGLKTKILAINVFCIAFTSSGSVSLKDGAGGASIINISRVTAEGQQFWMHLGGQVIGTGTANTLVQLHYNIGTATLAYQLVYYQAP